MSPSKQQNKISSVQLARFFEFYQEKKSSLTVENYPELVKELLLLIKTPIIFIHLQHYDEAITTFIKDIC